MKICILERYLACMQLKIEAVIDLVAIRNMLELSYVKSCCLPVSSLLCDDFLSRC